MSCLHQDPEAPPLEYLRQLREQGVRLLIGEGMARDRAKMIMGHAVLGGATDKYLLREELLRTIAPICANLSYAKY